MHRVNNYGIDLRSDIHTQPTPAMRRAMAEADVGGDALAGEDTAVRELEDAAAELFDKEAALLVCSGTMGNLVSLLAISRPGGDS
jgi:threonine aldolase